MTADEKQIKATAQGHNGPIELKLNVAQQRLKDIQVVHHSETPGIFNQVFAKLHNQILNTQSFDVDAISGATVMSKGILTASKQALTAAHVKLKGKPQKKVSEGTKTFTADVVVIGGGEAGLVAACRALSLGKRVILVEKNGYLGGATIFNGSNVTATGSKTAQRIFGSTLAKEDSPQKLVADVTRESHQTNTPTLTTLMANQIGTAIDFISDFAQLDYRQAQTQTPEHSVKRQIELPTSSSYELIQKVAAAFVKKGGKILLDTRVEKLIQTGTQIKGIVAKSKHQTVRVLAPAIILASGGYGANTKMRTAVNAGLDYYGPMTSTGDAYQFLAPLKLKTQHLDWYKVYPHGVETTPGIAKLTTYASKQATDMGAIYVNRQGQRIVNESAVYADLRDAILQQTDKIAFLVMDQRTWDAFYKLLLLHDFTATEIESYFAKAGQSSPILVEGTLSQAAQKAGIDVAGLTQTVQKYNQYAKTGKDPQFHRQPQYLHGYVGTKYYVIEQRDRFATSLGGFTAGSDLRLEQQNGTKIVNLFGAGEVVGGANGHDSMPSMMNSWAIASGYVAGMTAAQFNQKLDK